MSQITLPYPPISLLLGLLNFSFVYLLFLFYLNGLTGSSKKASSTFSNPYFRISEVEWVREWKGVMGKETSGLSYIWASLWLSGKESACRCRRCGFNPWVRKIPLEKEMATHSSTLACEIPPTEEPGRLQYMGLQKARYNLTIKQQKYELFKNISRRGLLSVSLECFTILNYPLSLILI